MALNFTTPQQPPPGLATSGSTPAAPSSLLAQIATNHGTPLGGVFANSDFVSDFRPRRQASAIIFGDTGLGKTYFGVRSCPEPVAFISMDRRGEKTIKDAMDDGRRIMPAFIYLPGNMITMSLEECRTVGKKLLDKVVKNVEVASNAAAQGLVRSIVFDTTSELDKIISAAMRGKLPDGKVVRDYGASKGDINRWWTSICDMARASSAHVLFIGRGKQIWDGNEPTGDFDFKGPDEAREAVDWVAQIRLGTRSFAPGGGGVVGQPAAQPGLLSSLLVSSGDGGGGSRMSSLPITAGPKKFELRITKSGNSIEQLGAVYSQDEWELIGGPFVYACTRLYPGTTPDDWR